MRSGHPLRVVITSPGRGYVSERRRLPAPVDGARGSASAELRENGLVGEDDRTDRMQQGQARFPARLRRSRGGAGMSLPFRERRALRGIEAGISFSDPRLASWLAFFSRLSADEDMPAHERGTLAIVRIAVAVSAAAAAAVGVVARAARASLHAVAAVNASTGHYGPLDSRNPPPVAGVPWYWHRYR